ncbi:MAG: flagellar hook-length control protein FliK [Thermoclostridium sp.]|nr:flagellar hook-length control protein FliK [Thermoclostridium sp.]
MVIINQQTTLPFLNTMVQEGKEKSAGADSFLSFLDKSRSNPLHASNNSAKSAQNIARPLKSNTVKASKGEPGIRLEPSEAAVQSEKTTEIQPETNSEQNTSAADAEMMKQTTAMAETTVEKTEEDQGLEDSESQVPQLKQSHMAEQLLAIMDEIITVLQQAATLSQPVKEENSANASGVSLQPLAAVHDELAKLLTDLTSTAAQLDGTETAAKAMVFARKLQQFLGEDSFKALLQDGLEISVSKGVSLEQLAGKMLNEAENAKLHLVQTSLQEITIPALKATAPKTTLTAEVPMESEDITAQTPAFDEKAIVLENASSEASQEQAEGDLQDKPQLRASLSKKTEGLVDLKPENMHEAVTDLQKPFGETMETVITQPVKPQAYSKTDVTAQIVEKAETMFREEKTEMVMQLKPDSLGKISLKVIHERGEIIARFVAESEQVKAILEGNMQLLKDSLQKSGVMVQSLEVSVGQQGGEQQRNWNNKQNEGLPLAEPKTSALQQRVLRQPAYGYGDTAAGYYSAESSEIDLTA